MPLRPATGASAGRAARVATWPRPGATRIVWAAPASQGGTPVQRYLVRLSAPNSTKRFGAWTANQGLSRLHMVAIPDQHVADDAALQRLDQLAAFPYYDAARRHSHNVDRAQTRPDAGSGEQQDQGPGCTPRCWM